MTRTGLMLVETGMFRPYGARSRPASAHPQPCDVPAGQYMAVGHGAVPLLPAALVTLIGDFRAPVTVIHWPATHW